MISASRCMADPSSRRFARPPVSLVSIVARATPNDHGQPLPPFGGAKWSGLGVENGPWGLLGFTEIQTVNIKKR